MNTEYLNSGLDLTRVDIRSRESWTLDLRGEFGGDNPDESTVQPAGTFTLSVCACEPTEVPIGEILIVHEGVNVSIVGHPTGRPGVVEITPEHLLAARKDSDYHRVLVAWLKGSA